MVDISGCVGLASLRLRSPLSGFISYYLVGIGIRGVSFKRSYRRGSRYTLTMGKDPVILAEG